MLSDRQRANAVAQDAKRAVAKPSAIPGVIPLPGVSQPPSLLLLLIGAAKRPSGSGKPITVVEERKARAEL